jgi:hypothetical protein
MPAIRWLEYASGITPEVEPYDPAVWIHSRTLPLNPRVCACGRGRGAFLLRADTSDAVSASHRPSASQFLFFACWRSVGNSGRA